MRLPAALQRVPRLAVDLAALLLVSLPALLPLAGPGYLWGHDAEDPPWRSLALAEAMSQGVLFPRWSADLFCGYGYPLFNFQSPLAFHPAAILSTVTSIGLLDASKVSFALALLMAATGAYFLARYVLGHRGAALLAGVLYLYSPAIIGDVYVRGTLGGVFALGLLPYALLAFMRLWDRPTLPASMACALLLAGLVLTHNVTAALALGVMAAYAGFRFMARPDAGKLAAAGATLILGLGVASFFWLPALLESGLTHCARVSVENFNWRADFVNPLGNAREGYESTFYLITNWGPFDLHPAYPYGGGPYKLGLLEGLLLVATAVLLVRDDRRPTSVVSLYLVALLLFFGHTSWSQWIWEAVPGADMLQFPWRLTRPLSLLLAVTGSWAVLQLGRGRHGWILPSVVGLAAMLSTMWLAPTEMKPFKYGSSITRDTVIRWQGQNPGRAGTTTDGQFLPLSVQWEGFGSHHLMIRYGQSYPDERWVDLTAFLPEGSQAWITATRKAQQWMEARVEAAETTTVALRAVYFAGWTAYLNGVKVPIEPASWREYEEGRRAALGVCQVDVPPGIHLVSLVFESTPVREWADRVSALSGGCAALLLVVGLWRRSNGGVVIWKSIPILALLAVVLAGYLLFLSLAAAGGPVWVENRVVRDLLEEHGEKKLRVVPPEGGKAEDYVLSKSFSIAGDTRPVLYMHPPASAWSRVWLPENARLEFALALDPQVWDKSGDGVEFQVAVRHREGLEVLFRRHVDPRGNPSDRSWIDGSVDLGRLAHREVEIILSTGHAGSPDFDWAGWANPRIVIHP